MLAMNERSLRDNLTEKDAELREQLETLRDEYDKAARDRHTNNQAVEGLQRALQEVQTRMPLMQFVSTADADEAQYGGKSSKSLSRPTSLKLTICGNKSTTQKKRQNWRKRRSSPRKRSLIEHCPSRKKSKRRISSSASSAMKP